MLSQFCIRFRFCICRSFKLQIFERNFKSMPEICGKKQIFITFYIIK